MEGLLAAAVLSVVLSATDSPAPAVCDGGSQPPLHADAVVQREILADLDGDGHKDLITGYIRPEPAEAYLHLRLTSGWTTRLLLDGVPVGQLDRPVEARPEGVVEMGDETVIVVNAHGILVGSAYRFVAFRDCALVPLTLESGLFPETWIGGGLHHTEWFTCRNDGVVQVVAGRDDADSQIHESATATFYGVEDGRFAAGVELAVELPVTLDQLRSLFPPCDLHGTFVDDDGSSFEFDIEWLAARGFTRGCDPPINDRFCPGAALDRGQMAAILSRALRLTGSDTDRFTDDDDSIFQTDIGALAAAGVTRGCNPPDNDRYCPHAAVSRGEMAAFLSRALGLSDTGSGNYFSDDDHSVFRSDVDRLAAAGITRGCNPPVNDRYCPHESVSRAQLAALLRRALG